jgi:hypothetical protein
MGTLVESSCENCGTKFERPPSQLGRFCGKACAYAARRKRVTTYRRMRYLPSHPLAGRTGLVSDARRILYDRIGPGWHPCHWCGCKVRWVVGARGGGANALVADHVDSDPLNDAPGNIVPACVTCNGTRTQSIKAGELFVVRPNGTRTRATERTCAVCGSKFLVAKAQLRIPGKGLACSRSCARKLRWQVFA